jgi:hypothetical protein
MPAREKRRKNITLVLDSNLYRRVRRAAVAADQSASAYVARLIERSVPDDEAEGRTPGQRFAEWAGTNPLGNRKPLETNKRVLMGDPES